MAGRRFSLMPLMSSLVGLCLLNGIVLASMEVDPEFGVDPPENWPGPFQPPETACADPSDCKMSSNRPDMVLLKVCEYEIRQFCLKHSVYDILTCLVDHSDRKDPAHGMSDACRKETQVQRWVLSPDFRLGPQAHPACSADVSRLCNRHQEAGGQPEVLQHWDEPKDDGARTSRAVTSCLKKHLALKRLSGDCTAYMTVYMREGSLNYQKDEPFAFECQTEIRRHCQSAVPRTEDDARNGELYECMKLKFLAHFISDQPCREQLITSLQASRSELRTDPVVYSACYRDLGMWCGAKAPGHGRHMACLQRRMEAGGKMELQCMHLLRRRLAMWKFGAMVSPQSFPDYVVSRSSSNFLFVYMNYVVAAGAILLAIIFSFSLVLVINKKRRMRKRNNVHYIRIEQAKEGMN